MDVHGPRWMNPTDLLITCVEFSSKPQRAARMAVDSWWWQIQAPSSQLFIFYTKSSVPFCSCLQLMLLMHLFALLLLLYPQQHQQQLDSMGIEEITGENSCCLIIGSA